MVKRVKNTIDHQENKSFFQGKKLILDLLISIL